MSSAAPPPLVGHADATARAWLRRMARSPRASSFVLRGSLLVGAWSKHARPAADVDHLVLGVSSVDEVRAAVEEILAMPDEGGLPLDRSRSTHEIIWAETAQPGLRTTLWLGESTLRIDAGFGDPLTQAPAPLHVLGEGPLFGVRPETMFAWKTHGLFEFGRGRWRAKDLYDLWLLDRDVPMDAAALVDATRVAFESRGTELSAASRFLETSEWGTSRGGRRRWSTFARGATLRVPAPDFVEVTARVRARIAPIFAALGSGRT
ncbi:MAG: nucleotidyl transferase AbiEii/AbiGii toxin family protein [Deltaproteobacteria bacterium]|nr:nucleotidyl transferase AbiEii/AbiGii toxin family protein [Deltaproteobacteria bacterium]